MLRQAANQTSYIPMNSSVQCPRHFLSLLDLKPEELKALLSQALKLKHQQYKGIDHATLTNKVLIMIFEKSSTRTRVSFEVAMRQLGGYALFLSARDTQLGRGETIGDSARVLTRMADVSMVRTHAHERLLEFARHSSVPVINGLTDHLHPCQLLADMLTYSEKRGDIQGRTVAWIGDGNNMCHSYINAARQLDFNLRIACPPEFQPNASSDGDGTVTITDDPAAAVANADLVVTDVWTSMGQEQERAERLGKFKRYQVDSRLMRLAHKDALFMHCLPAHREEEVTREVLEGAQSVVWEEAENRLHAQKALLRFLLSGTGA